MSAQGTHGDPTRVLIVDDQALMREGLQALLDLTKDLAIIGVAADGSEALDAVTRLRPHVVLMDIVMPGMDGIAATRAIVARGDDTRVLMLTTFGDDELVAAALGAGASGYVLKNTPAAQLARAIHAVRHGEPALSPEVARRMMATLAALHIPPPPDLGGRLGATAMVNVQGRERLSEREVAVLRLAARGLNNHEIASALRLADGTVKNYMSSLLSKLHARDRMQAVLIAQEHGLL